METITKQKTFKAFHYLMIGVGISILPILGVFNLSVDTKWQQMTPAAEKTYQSLRDEAKRSLVSFCESGWKPLAKAKALDAINGGSQEVDIQRMSEIANAFDCSKIEAPATFQ